MSSELNFKYSIKQKLRLNSETNKFDLFQAFPGLSVIGEEGHVDFSKVVEDVLVEGFDEKVFGHFEGKIPDRFTAAQIKDLTVWVDPLDGTQVNIATFPTRDNKVYTNCTKQKPRC